MLQLPLYAEPRQLTDYTFVEQEPLPLERGVRAMRYAVQDKYAQFSVRRGCLTC